MAKAPIFYRIDVVPLTPLFGQKRDPRFSYAAREPVAPGSLVSISFGKRMLTGVTLDVTPLPGPVPPWMKFVDAVRLPGWLTTDQIALAWHLSEHLYTPLGLVFKLFFPIQQQPRVTKKNAAEIQTVSQSTETRRTRRRKRRGTISYRMEAVNDDIQLLQRLISFGKQALTEHQPLCILVPEVLAAELYTQALERALPQARIGCLTSRRTNREQYALFRAIRIGGLDIIVGTRQAVFAPYVSLGHIVIVDSEKQLSFTQWEMAPRYDAVEIARWLAVQFGTSCTQLSPAPGIAYFATDKTLMFSGRPFVFSSKRSLTTIDLRQLYTRHTAPVILTPTLIETLRTTLTRPSSVLILVKQRGLARFSVCAQCRTPNRCPRCQTALTEMADGRFRCLHCAYRTSLFPACASCGHMHFKNFGAGTQAIVRALKREGLSDAVITIDRDTTQLKHDFHTLVSTLSHPVRPMVIIATYEAASALPLPPLGLIAMIEPDQGLFYPDYQSEERLWRELRRFGAKLEIGGQLIAQTFEPASKHWTIWARQPLAITATHILEERRALHYPPSYELLQLECFPRQGLTSLAVAETIEAALHELALPQVEILPRYLPFNRKNRYHVLIRYPRVCDVPKRLHTYLTTLGPHIRITHNPLSLL